jgi:iron complex outermembrane receptor protein
MFFKLIIKMRLKVIFMLLFGITISSPASMQEGDDPVLSGRVSGRDGAPLAGASIVITNTNTGVLSGTDGTYSIGLPEGSYSIRFSYVGYEPQIRTVNLENDVVLDIVLEEKVLMTEDVIIKATRAGEHAPLAYTNISQELIMKQNTGQDLPFLLSLTPSLIETSEAGNGVGYTSLRIRGTDASRINVTIDGIPLNDAESQQVFWVDLPDLASSVDNIQVQRGVGTSSNGAGAFGASVNIQTRGIERKPFAEINSSAGSFNTFKNSLAAGTGLLYDKFAFQMRYSDIRSDGFIERTGSKHNSAFLSGIYRTEKSLLKANILLGKEHTGIGWWGVPGELLPVSRRYNPAGEYTDDNGITQYYNNENHFQLIYTTKINNILSFHTALHYTKGAGYYEEYKEDRSLSGYGLPDIVQGGTTITTTDLIQRKWLSNDFYGLIYSLGYNNKKLEANLGGSLNLYSGDHYGRIIWMRYPGNTKMDQEWYLNNGEKGEMSFYGKANYSLSRKFMFFGDLQYRYIRYKLRGPDDDLKDIGQNHSYNFFNPKAGFFFSITPDMEAFLSASVANREPARADFKEAAGDPEAMPGPERLYDIEAGYKLRTGKSSFSVNLYDMIYKDQLVPTGELSNVGYPITTNVEKSYRAGIELTAGIIPTDFIQWNFSLTLSQNKIPAFTEYYVDYNTSDGTSEYKSRVLGSVDIAYSPSLTGSSDLALKLFPVLNFHLISKYVGKQYFDNTMNNERIIDPYFVNNIRIDYEPARKLKGAQLQLLINNILNVSYESNAYGGNWFEDGIEKTWSYYFPQAGMNFMVRLGLKF